MNLPARVSLLTLACRDVERMAQLFRDLGWPETPGSDEHHRTFQCTNGVVIACYGAKNYEPEFGPPAEGFRGFTIAVNLESFEETRQVYEALKSIDGVELLGEPEEADWGGGFAWRDPEGNVWDVAWAKGTSFTETGGLLFP
jgi:uncharacterized glyoxalase superfamily protein PhnB